MRLDRESASQSKFPSRTRVRAPWAIAMMAALAFAVAVAAPEGNAVAERIAAQVDAGDFKGAEAAIAQGLADKSTTPEQRTALAFERERMRRIGLDFPLREADVRAKVREAIPDLRDDEFRAWDDANLLEHLVIDGEKRYFSRSVGNLWRLSPAAVARRATPPKFTDSPYESLHPYHARVREAALASGKTSVLPHRVRIKQSLTVEADAVPAGETVRAWIPYPRAIPGHQDDIRFVSSTPAKATIAPESTLQRTAYMERKAEQGKPTQFEVEYEVTLSAQYHPIDADKVQSLSDKQRKDLAPFLDERAPHVVFTDDLRKLSRDTVGDEKNPYRIAQKLFRLVDDKFPWAGAREYSTLRNISDYTLHAHHGDCGQQTLLLITLLRLNGIPARWQSGMMFSDTDYWNLHDWGQVYLAPYGWVPMDVTFGRFDGAPDGPPATEWFYLGGLDAWRIAFNDDWSTPFVPAKTHFRSETVDSQRGEVEWRGGNLYFDQFDYDFTWHVLSEGK